MMCHSKGEEMITGCDNEKQCLQHEAMVVLLRVAEQVDNLGDDVFEMNLGPKLIDDIRETVRKERLR